MYLACGLFLPAHQSARGKTTERERRGGQQNRTLEHRVHWATQQPSCCLLEIRGPNSAVEVRDKQWFLGPASNNNRDESISQCLLNSNNLDHDLAANEKVVGATRDSWTIWEWPGQENETQNGWWRRQKVTENRRGPICFPGSFLKCTRTFNPQLRSICYR